MNGTYGPTGPALFVQRWSQWSEVTMMTFYGNGGLNLWIGEISPEELGRKRGLIGSAGSGDDPRATQDGSLRCAFLH